MLQNVKRIVRLILIILSVLFVFGIVYFFFFQNGVSYFTDKPEACLNCHVMQVPFDTWTKSSHAAVATCNDCHLSRGFTAKTVEKIKNGFVHSKALVLKAYKEPLTIHSENKPIVQKNCARCHGETTQTNENHEGMDASTNCLTCHAQVGHRSN